MKDIVKLVVGIIIVGALTVFALETVCRSVFIYGVKQNTTDTAQIVNTMTVKSVAPNHSTDTRDKAVINKDERNTTNSLAVVLIVMMFMGAISSANRR
jgi:hypothetical protein